MLVNLRHSGAVRAAIFALQKSRLGLRLSIQKHLAKECGLAAGDRVEILFGFGRERGVVVAQRASEDRFGYRLSKRGGSHDIQVNVTRLPDYLVGAMATAPCKHVIKGDSLEITLPAAFIMRSEPNPEQAA